MKSINEKSSNSVKNCKKKIKSFISVIDKKPLNLVKY